MPRKSKSWNNKVSFYVAAGHCMKKYQELLDKINSSKKEATKKRNWRHLFYYATALIQLRNGLRAEESVRALITFYKTRKKEFLLESLKHGDERPVVIPKVITWYDVERFVPKVLGFYSGKKSINPYYSQSVEKQIAQAYKQWIKEKEGEILKNSHSLRYAFMDYVNRKGLPVDMISRMLGHKKLDTTYNYLRTTDVMDKLKDLIDW